MALESTNNWTINNYREIPYYDVPFAVLMDVQDVPESKLNRVFLDLYNGATFKTKVSYLVANDATPDEADLAKWDAINIAKNRYLEEKYL